MAGLREVPKKRGSERGAAIDGTMERASAALVAMRYFEAERLCLRALGRAYELFDYERMARILMPLQEARRLKRQLAVDAGAVRVVGSAAEVRGPVAAGCYLFRPPLIGADARAFRERA